MIDQHTIIVFIDYVTIITSIPAFILLSLYMWIKTAKKLISKISLIWFLVSFLVSAVLFFLFLCGVVNSDTEIPRFFSRYIEESLSKEKLDVATLSYIAWFILVFSWWYIAPIMKKFNKFSFLGRYRKRITLFLSSHQYSVVISFSIIYTSLLLVSVADFFSVAGNYWLLFLFYWSIFVLFTAAPSYISPVLGPGKGNI